MSVQGQGTSEQNDPVLKALNDTQEDRAALQGLLDPLFVSMFTDFLNIVFEWFPHTRGDGSDNERAFVAIRHRVLRKGNQSQREAGHILSDFAVTQLRTRQVVTKYEVKGHGPFNLPPNVQIRPRSPRRG